MDTQPAETNPETTVDNVDETVTDEVTTEAAEQKVIDWQAEAEKLKAESRKHEARAKENFELAKKWKEYEDSQKSEDEKLVEELAKVKAENAAIKAEALIKTIASEKNIPSKALKLLTGSTREELEASADEILSIISESAQPNKPQPNPEQGKPAGTSGQIFKDELKNMSAAEIMKAKSEGRLDDMLGNK